MRDKEHTLLGLSLVCSGSSLFLDTTLPKDRDRVADVMSQFDIDYDDAHTLMERFNKFEQEVELIIGR